MAQDWFVTLNGQQVGPISAQQLKEYAASGQLQPTDTVWKEGMAQWQPASSVKGLFGGGGASPITTQGPAQQYGGGQFQGMAPAPASANFTLSKNFKFDGGPGDFFITALLAYLLAGVTCGIGTPWSLCMMQRWIAEHTTVQGRRLKFIGTGGELFVIFLVGYLLSAITCGIYTIWFVPKLVRWITEHTDFQDA
jgi:hypothetical protein